jgi:hypothetical protein
MKEILDNINNSVPDNIKNDIKRRFATWSVNFIQFSNHLKQVAHNNYDIRNILFKNNEEALYFAGDILAKTLYNFWIKGGDLESHFVDNAKQTSYHAEFECLWN